MGGGRPGYEEIKLIDFGMTRVLVDGAGEQVMGGTPEFIGRYYCFSLENILFSIIYSRIIFSFTLNRILFQVYLDIFSQFFIILRT